MASFTLDFGCGSGEPYMGEGAMGDSSSTIIGIDINSQRLTIANFRIETICCDGTHLPFRSSVFGNVVTSSVLEHIKDYRKALVEIRRVLKVGGFLMLSQSVDDDPIFFVARRLAKSWNGDGVFSCFRSTYLLRILSSSGFKIKSISYLPNAPITGFLGFFHRRPSSMLSRIESLRHVRLIHKDIRLADHGLC
ncbi:MAG: class I SAM-dependent methyltransferase [Nitrososphaerales archaeon]